MNIKEKFNEYIASGDPIISISDEQRDWILPFIERCVGEERKDAYEHAEIVRQRTLNDIVEMLDDAGDSRGARAIEALTQEDKIK